MKVNDFEAKLLEKIRFIITEETMPILAEKTVKIQRRKFDSTLSDSTAI